MNVPIALNLFHYPENENNYWHRQRNYGQHWLHRQGQGLLCGNTLKNVHPWQERAPYPPH
jgi:hypothetical protein